ncbi:MAG TPA: hypothetical protein VM938_06015 [Acidimicrobiales bacterium]|nr:hypothetical protein [Acidimicrobiales bacterium]
MATTPMSSMSVVRPPMLAARRAGILVFMREKATAASFLPLVVAAGLVAAIVGVAGLAIPVSAGRPGDEGTNYYDCGTPAAFLTGRSFSKAQPMIVGSPVIGKAEACRAAMAPRLGLTTWAFGLGLAATVLLGGLVFAASAWTPRAAHVGAVAAVLVVGAVVWAPTEPADAVAACDVLPADEVVRVLGVRLEGRAFEPQATTAHSSGCGYGRAPGVHMIVFAVGPGGKDFHRQPEGKDVSGPGYRAHVGAGPRERSESLVVLRGDQYVNVVVYDAPPGTAERFAPIAARWIVRP